MAISHQATKWIISKNTEPPVKVFSTTQQVSDTVTGEVLDIPFYAGLEPDVEYLVEGIHVANIGLESAAGTLIFTPEGIMIQAPIITAPTEGVTIPLNTAVNVASSAFLTIPPDKDTHAKSEWQVSKVANFASTIVAETSSTKLTAFTIPANILEANTTYYVRVAYHSETLLGPFSNAISFKTASQVADIDPPTLVTPAIGVKVDCKTFALAAGPFKNNNPAASSHTATIWQLGRKADFADIAWQSESTSNKISVSVPGSFLAPGTTYFLRIKFLSNSYSSPWSETFEVATQDLAITYNLLPSPPSGLIAEKSLHFFADAGDSSLLGAGFLTSNHNSDPASSSQTLIYISAFNVTTQQWGSKTYTEYDGVAGANPIFFKAQRPIWDINNDFHNKMANVVGTAAMSNYNMSLNHNHMFFTYENKLSATSKESIFGRIFTGGFQQIMKTTTNNADATALANHKEHMVKGAAGNYVYALFGDAPNLLTFKKYNLTTAPASTVWEPCASLPSGAVLDTRLITFGTYLYGYGSYGTTSAGKPKSALFIYNTSTNTWEIVPADDSPSLFFRTDAACEMVGDYFYIHGGKGETQGIVNELWRCSVISKKWAKLNAGGEVAQKHVAWSKNNKLYLSASKLYSIDLSNVPGCEAEEPPEEQVTIQKPLITSPSPNQALSANDIRATCSQFSATPNTVTHYSTSWEACSDQACTQRIDSISNGVGSLLYNAYFSGSYFQPGVTYFIRCRHNGKRASDPDPMTVYRSEWSEPRAFTVSVQAVKPVIIEPADEAEVPYSGFTIRANPYATNPPSSAPHTKTQWQVSSSRNSFFDNLMVINKETTSPSELTQLTVPSSALIAGQEYGIRVMFNGNGIWSDAIQVKTKASSGWETVIEYDDTDVFNWDGRLLNACICSSSSIDTRQSLFLFGNAMSGGAINPAAWEYPLDGSPKRSVPCDMVDYCYFMPFMGSIYRFRVRTGNMQIDKLNLMSRLWSSVPIVNEGGQSLNGQFIWGPFMSIAVGKNCIVFCTHQYPIPSDAQEGKPTMRIWQLFASPVQKIIAYDYWQSDFPGIGVNKGGSYFLVDSLICTTPSSISGYERMLITRFSPVTNRYWLSGGDAGVTTELTKFNAYPSQYDPQSVVTTKSQPASAWNPVYLRSTNEILWNTYRNPGAGIAPSTADFRASTAPIIVMDPDSLEVKRTIPRAPNAVWLFANNYDGKIYMTGIPGSGSGKFLVKRYVS